eukprot:c27763_g1_i1 orf=106-345(+)
MFEELLPQTVMEQEFQQSNAENQPSNQHNIGPHDVEKVVREEKSKIPKERAIPSGCRVPCTIVDLLLLCLVVLVLVQAM